GRRRRVLGRTQRRNRHVDGNRRAQRVEHHAQRAPDRCVQREIVGRCAPGQRQERQRQAGAHGYSITSSAVAAHRCPTQAESAHSPTLLGSTMIWPTVCTMLVGLAHAPLAVTSTWGVHEFGMVSPSMRASRGSPTFPLPPLNVPLNTVKLAVPVMPAQAASVPVPPELLPLLLGPTMTTCDTLV